MKQAIAVLGMALLGFGASAPAQATPLADLLNGATITVGDKLFDQWRLLGRGLVDTTGTVNLAGIDVVGIDETSLNPGLRFNAGSQLQVAGDNFIDLFFGYRVSVLPGSNQAIQDVSFSFDSESYGGDGLTAGIEDVFDTASNLLGSIELEASNQTFVISGSAGFNPQREIQVQSNILLFGFVNGDSAGLDSFTQRFSQTAIPEPGTLLLFGVALGGLFFPRRARD